MVITIYNFQEHLYVTFQAVADSSKHTVVNILNNVTNILLKYGKIIRKLSPTARVMTQVFSNNNYYYYCIHLDVYTC